MITVVTPWIDHPELAKDYWMAMRAADATVLVIDDGSDPPLLNAVRQERQGFARSCNRGLRLAQTPAVLFLNNDIEMTSPDWLQRIEGALEPGVLVGEVSKSPHGSVDGIAFPYIDGWCLAGMREDLLALGGFDETFEEPSYYGDNDLCLRARAAGMSLRPIRPGLRHKRNGTSSFDDPETIRATEINRARFVNRARELLEAT